jgi:hypothetical protein
MYIKKLSAVAGLLLALALPVSVNAGQGAAGAAALPIFDAHIHFSNDARAVFKPEEMIRRLRAVGVTRALVSSSSDEGTQLLYQADPDFVVPSLRPYRERGELQNWMHDDSVIPYLKERLAQYRYAAIGELHIDDEEANTPVMREVVRLARQHGLMLHVHSDAEAIRYIFQQDPEARILWAHAGFEPAETVRELLVLHDKLWADLSFRYDILADEVLSGEWRELLVDHADRFLLGMDTFTPQRWLEIGEIMHWQRQLLAALPVDAAEQIAYRNGEWLTRTYDQVKN